MFISYRVTLATTMPQQYLSIVSDGMAQNHSLLPWSANAYQFSNYLTQHFQGVLAHGRSLTMNRSFHNLSNTANLQIHSLLLMLEELYIKHGRIPDNVFYQLDGGTENTAKVVLMMCELIVIKRLTKKITLSRLMVGHTHCDIDAVFGRLWKYARTRHILTPQAYELAVTNALSTAGYKAKVVDIFVVPDYTSYFEGCGDNNFGKYSKLEATQLQFCFEAIEPSIDFPNGVKTTYRAYSANETIEIVQSKTVNNNNHQVMFSF